MHDLYSKVRVTTLIPPLVINNDTEGAPAAQVSVDLKDANTVMFIAALGAEGDTLSASVKYELICEDSDDNTTWAAVDSGDYIVGMTPEATSGILYTYDDPAKCPHTAVFGYRKRKRYVRARWETTGTLTNGTPGAIVAVVGGLSLSGSYATS